ncbi:MAG: DinB family protein [Aeromicrobium sp.]|uniref:DinB family protein n=1 Tax=Aeromicrobium sp. TaxID=1871063 RepID=UPI0039E4ED38
MTAPELPPDDKDWTWVLRERCPECGFDASTVDPAAVGPSLRRHVAAWRRVLGRADATRRRRPDRWSDIEYACHVRDVFTVFAARIDRMLAEAPARFEDWDQDAAAVEGRYAEADPAEVARELGVAADRLAAALARVDAGSWGRRGLRSNGSEFTVGSLTRYALHDLEHHLVDVGADL